MHKMNLQRTLQRSIVRYYGPICTTKQELIGRVGLGKQTRPSIVCSIAHKHNEHTRVCAAAMETLHTAFLIADDVCDNAKERNGQLAWHSIHGANNAWNDANFLVSTSTRMINDCFAGSLSSVVTSELSDTIATACIGQRTDMNVNLESVRYSEILDVYEQMCFEKTGNYTFGLPIKLGLLLSDRDPTVVREHIQAVSLHLGCIYQSCNDIRSTTNEDLLQRRLTWMAAVVVRNHPSIQTLLLDPKVLLQQYDQNDLASMHKVYCKKKTNLVMRHLDQMSEMGFQEAADVIEPFTREWI